MKEYLLRRGATAECTGKVHLYSACEKVEAETADFHGATYAKTPMGHFPVVAAEPARVAAASHTGKVFADPPQLVWKFCNESTNPWHPFYLLTATDGTVAYVRHDGAVFGKLTRHSCASGG